MQSKNRFRSNKENECKEGTSYVRSGRVRHFPNMAPRSWMIFLLLTGSAALVLLMSRDLPENHVSQARRGIGVGASPIDVLNREEADPDANLGFLRDKEGFINENQEETDEAPVVGDSFIFHRLIHLDLKGAPPKVSYYRQTFPLFRKLGATGLLIEYEDMFPYWGKLAPLAARNAYTKEEIGEIQKLASENNLIIIPLVQTFGHMEFVLKHDRFADLREMPDNPQGIHPAKQASRHLVYEIINQMMSLHPNVTHIHLGGDEVYTLGSSDFSKDLMKHRNFNRTDLYLYHITPILEYVRKRFNIMSILWDDMMRKIPLDVLKSARIASLVEPMVWVYLHKITERVPASVWDKYAQVFPNVWVASAFKGATGRHQFITDINHHRRNHIAWIKTIRNERRYFKRFQGMALTGWQRYDHFAPLCELLPVGLPSLGVCLQSIMHSSFDAHVHQKVSEMLNCEGPLELHLDSKNEQYSRCNFPGSQIYENIHVLYSLKHMYDRLRYRYDMFVTEYNSRHGHINGQQIADYVMTNKTYITQTVMSLNKTLPPLLSQIYYPDMVIEWMDDNVYSPYNQALDLLNKIEPLTKINKWSSRPYD